MCSGIVDECHWCARRDGGKCKNDECNLYEKDEEKIEVNEDE